MAWPKFERTAEHNKKIGDAIRGIKRTPEQNERNAAARRGRNLPEETRQKMRDVDNPARFVVGHAVSAEVREKISRSNKARSGLLRRYGIDNDEYERQSSLGNRWCAFRKHFAVAEGFRSKDAVCAGCRSEHYRKSGIKQKFGVDQAWYEEKLAEQSGVCAVCKSSSHGSKRNKFFAIDHDHKTGRLRGLLCNRCNNALERLDSIPGWAESAMIYLKHHGSPDTIQ